MAYGRDGSRTPHLSNRATVIWLALLFILALGLRVALNVDPSYDEETDRYLYSGNDPYYHDRTVRHILDEGESLIFDPSINYPTGGFNPNPPIYDWTSAIVITLVDPLIDSDAVGLVLNFMAGFWGALTILPVYMIAAALWDRRAGIWAAFFMAASAPHIQRGIFGFADHDATTMFFITLTFAFVIKALKTVQDHEYVDTWKDPTHIGEGFRRTFAYNKVAFTWAALAGTALASTALVWKGYPYVLAVLAVGLGFQLLIDHARNKDSLAVWLIYLTPLVLVTLLPLPYYLAFPGFLGTTIHAGLYVLYGALIVGAILVPTRELPSIIVFPALAIAAIAGLLAMIFVFPQVGQTVFTGLGYFEQTKLYTTIAEARRTELGTIAANFGFFAFLLAFWGLGRAIKHGFKGNKGMLLMASWAVVAIFMAFAANRFLTNAAPVFAILAATVTVTVTKWLGTEEVRRRFRALHGQANTFARGMKSLTTRTTLGVILVASLLVLPNLWLSVDAATSFEFDREHGLVDNDPSTVDRFGAFGLSFDIKQNGWLDAFNHLATLDQDQPFHERPAFMAWWDYGHWATSLGKHPTVADPFQNNHQIAGRFLASESEREAIMWMTILMIRDDLGDGELSPGVKTALEAQHPDLADIPAVATPDERFALMDEHVTEGEAYLLYDEIAKSHGKKIGYMGVDSRMYPLGVQDSGIFYAPVFLADKNPDDFVPIIYQGQQGQLQLQLKQYGMDANNHSFRLKEPIVEDAQGNEWIVFDNQAWQKGRDPITLGSIEASGPGTPVTPTIHRGEKFANSMYARAFGFYGIQQGGLFEQRAAGEGLSHWRVIHKSMPNPPFPSVVMLEYYSGYQVSGQVTTANGEPLADVQVTIADGFGAGHHQATTDAEGEYTLLSPFGEDLQLVVSQDGEEVYSMDFPAVTREQAAGQSLSDFDVQIPLASIEGFVYWDKDGDRILSADDEVLDGVQVLIDGQNVTTDSDGKYRLGGLQPGSYTVSSTPEGFTGFNQPITLKGGEERELDIRLIPKQSETKVTFTDGGEPVAGVKVRLSGPGDDRNVTTNGTGIASTTLGPGTYQITVDESVTQEGVEVTYRARKTVEVPFGGEPFSVTLANGEGYS